MGISKKVDIFFIDGMQLYGSDNERDLNAIFSRIFKWKNQVLIETNKANQMMGRIKKSFAKFDCNLLKYLYSTFIRPLLEFGVHVWLPYFKGDLGIPD